MPPPPVRRPEPAEPRRPSQPGQPEPAWTISQLARELEVSTRTIRYYEEKGLISPGRTAGNQRVYGKRERARLKLILRGKRFGYTLEEIGEMIGLAAVDLDEEEQIRRALAYGERKLAEIGQRLQDLQDLARDIEGVRARLRARLAELRPGQET
jgi:DNA-binding transcriptional MerR regulator